MVIEKIKRYFKKSFMGVTFVNNCDVLILSYIISYAVFIIKIYKT